jgi:hypothetical protein
VATPARGSLRSSGAVFRDFGAETPVFLHSGADSGLFGAELPVFPLSGAVFRDFGAETRKNNENSKISFAI